MIEELEISRFGCFIDEHCLETAEECIELLETNQSFKISHESGILSATIVAKDERNMTFYFAMTDDSSCFSLKPEESGAKNGNFPQKWDSRLTNTPIGFLVEMGIWCIIPSSISRSDSIVIVSPVADEIIKIFSVYCRSDHYPNPATQSLLCHSHWSTDVAFDSSSHSLCIAKTLVHRPPEHYGANQKVINECIQEPPRYREYVCQTPGLLKLITYSHYSERLQPILVGGEMTVSSVPAGASSYRLCYTKTRTVPALITSLNRIGYHDLSIDIDNSSIQVRRLKVNVNWKDDNLTIQGDELKSVLEVSKLLID